MNTFYKTNGCNIVELLTDSYTKSFDYHCDILDANKSWARRRTDIEFDEALSKITEASHAHVVFIKRDNEFVKFKLREHNLEDLPHYYEVGISGGNVYEPTYYIFLYLKPDDGRDLIQKYKLTKLK